MDKKSMTAPKERPLSGAPERSKDSRSESLRSSGEPDNGRAPTPGPFPNETLERPKRRTFTADYKLKILQEADTATAPGAIGELLRREGLYSSHLASWRRDRDAGAMAGLGKRRGPSPRQSVDKKRILELERENERLRKKLTKAELLVDVQKKLHELMASPVTPNATDDSTP